MRPEQNLVAPAEVAEYLGITTQSLAVMRMNGSGPEFIRVNTRNIRYRWSVVEAWLNEQTHSTTDEYAS